MRPCVDALALLQVVGRGLTPGDRLHCCLAVPTKSNLNLG